jgi:hypothetical protein
MVSLSGCSGGGEKPTAPVSGNVTFEGKPVEGGSLTFTPQATGPNPGKQGAASIQKDGSFLAGTYSQNDGVLIGKVRISYSAPSMPFPEGGLKPGEQEPRSPYYGLVPKQTDAEIKAGSNTLDVELIRGGSAAAPDPKKQ